MAMVINKNGTDADGSAEAHPRQVGCRKHVRDLLQTQAGDRGKL